MKISFRQKLNTCGRKQVTLQHCKHATRIQFVDYYSAIQSQRIHGSIFIFQFSIGQLTSPLNSTLSYYSNFPTRKLNYDIVLSMCRLCIYVPIKNKYYVYTNIIYTRYIFVGIYRIEKLLIPHTTTPTHLCCLSQSWKRMKN